MNKIKKYLVPVFILILLFFGKIREDVPNGALNPVSTEAEILNACSSAEAKETIGQAEETGTLASAEERLKDADLSEDAERSSLSEDTDISSGTDTEKEIPESGIYQDKESVSLYIYLYGHLPGNYITKKKAGNLGWTGGGLDEYLNGGMIGGDSFGNYEGKLPEKKGRKYYECDIDTMHQKSRGAKRIVYSNDGLIYYTEDHYETFILLYGDEG